MIDIQNRRHKDIGKFVCLSIVFINISLLVLFTFGGMLDLSHNAFYIRHWHYLLAVFSGGSLGVAGLLLQKLTKNNLSDISIVGIGSLNIICIILYLVFFFDGDVANLPKAKLILPIISIASSIFGTFLIYYLSKRNKYNFNNIIITGISVQFLFEAANIAILNSIPNQNISVNNTIATEIGNYSYGKFGDISRLSIDPSWRIMTIVSFVLIVLICCLVFRFRRQLDLIEINDEYAESNGVRVKALKIFLFLCVALLAGIESALVGTISLLGIIAPNVSKIIFGNRSSTNILSSFVIGAILVLAATFLSVNLSQNIPIGILSTAIIIPFFIYLIFKGK